MNSLVRQSIVVTALSLLPGLLVPAYGQKLETEKDRQSYAVGVQMGKALVSGKDLISIDIMLNGLMDVLEGKDTLIEEAECTTMFRKWQTAAREQQAASAGAEGEAYLEENGAKEGVITLPSGLQYEVLKTGTGPIPTRSDTVRAHYAGTLIDGTEFDSSYKRNEPLQISVTGVIAGWTEALLLMNEGSKWRLTIPHELGYGARGAGGSIPPYSTLIFEMELVEIVK